MPAVIQIHPYDPTIPNAGGIGSIIRSLIRFAPPDFRISLVGITHDRHQHPLGRWSQVEVDGTALRFMPVLEADRRVPSRIPLTLRFALGLWRHRHMIETDGSILEFHRIEPSLVFLRRPATRTLFLHCDPAGDLLGRRWEAKWRHLPATYGWLEDQLIRPMRQVWMVREDAATRYRGRFAPHGVAVDFLPTWVDSNLFAPAPAGASAALRTALAREHGFDAAQPLILFVGRFAAVKDPLLLLQAFVALRQQHPNAVLVMIGTGDLLPPIEAFVRSHGLSDAVRLPGTLGHCDVARWMNVADCLCLSSITEGMPVTLLEALSCGLPIVSTDVGEAARLVPGPAAGRLVAERTPAALAAAIAETLAQARDRAACVQFASPYTAPAVLRKLHERYRELYYSALPPAAAGAATTGTGLRSVRRSKDSKGRSISR
ncbi:glycosyltransferase involved in cell wall biosynthesis [Pseudoduganella flava]|uniref:Glycosyltransferase n=1 Tax=Pseudoduganella flava TaxID=871742 RepID=A0A562PH30_9BURK|nr:glycosyltransferase [Pseudoduganella flava]QGZ42609.1 glycosyltransferase [Pseudoduganella flava]TWI43765.1 glycosyltransferase involved in cell wall biosynthesis [Pseudoduganella flava]